MDITKFPKNRNEFNQLMAGYHSSLSDGKVVYPTFSCWCCLCCMYDAQLMRLVRMCSKYPMETMHINLARLFNISLVNPLYLDALDCINDIVPCCFLPHPREFRELIRVFKCLLAGGISLDTIEKVLSDYDYHWSLYLHKQLDKIDKSEKTVQINNPLMN